MIERAAQLEGKDVTIREYGPAVDGAHPIGYVGEPAASRIVRVFSAGRAPTDTPPCFSLPLAEPERFSQDGHGA
jgi:hypothetical protein